MTSLFAAVALAAAFGAAEPHPSAAETRAELERVCRELTTGTNPYFGEALVPRLEARVAATPLTERSLAVRLRGRLSHDLVRLGRFDAAIAVLEEAHALTRGGGFEGAEALDRLVTSSLATAHLLLAEDRNCLERHSDRSCILPLAEDAVHRLPEHSRRAGDLFAELIEPSTGPGREHWQERWLLNLARMLSGQYPDAVPAEHRLPPGALDGAPLAGGSFRDVGSKIGFTRADLAGGAVMDDFDGDGRLDLVSSSWHPCAPLTVFRNGGEGAFTEVAESWGLDGQLGGLNLSHADFDGDGHLDLLVLRGAWLGDEGRVRNSLLRNELDTLGRFVDVTADVGLAYPAFPTQNAAWADYDGDGDLDLFVGNESDAGTTDPLAFGERGAAFPSQLFRNELRPDGRRVFVDVAERAGVTNLRFAKGSAWGDFDDDGDPDLYVSNLGANRLYRNDGGRFVDVAPSLGVTGGERSTFACWFFDHDNDGDLDLFVAGYDAPIAAVSASYLGHDSDGGAPLLFENRGGRFEEISTRAGLVRPILAMGANYGDLDNDGFLDFYLGTGVPDFSALMPNVMYRNRGGARFEDVTFAGGFGHLQKGHGVAFGDLDGDGDQDLFQQLGGAYPSDAYRNAVYENPGNDNAWVVLRLEGKKANRFGVGARITVRTRSATEDGEGRIHHALVGTGGSFGSSSLQQELGLGETASIEEIRVRWPGSGTVDRFANVTPNRYYRVVEGAKALVPLTAPRAPLTRPETTAGHSHESRNSR